MIVNDKKKPLFSQQNKSESESACEIISHMKKKRPMESTQRHTHIFFF